MTKTTNLDLAPTPRRGNPSKPLFEREGVVDVFLKLDAEGRDYQYITDYLNKNHPRSDGDTWKRDCMYAYKRSLLKNLKEKRAIIANTNTDVADKIASGTMDITSRLQQVDQLVGKWLEQVDTEQEKKVVCKKCRKVNKVKVFDPDKAVRVADQMRRLMLTAQKLTDGLPDVKMQNKSLTHLDPAVLLKKLVKDGAVIVTDKEKLSEYGISLE